jgi:hypothetical protein
MSFVKWLIDFSYVSCDNIRKICQDIINTSINKDIWLQPCRNDSLLFNEKGVLNSLKADTGYHTGGRVLIQY